MSTTEHFSVTSHGSTGMIPRDLPLRKWLYLWLLCPSQKGNHHKTIDHWISILILANLAALVTEHIPAIYTLCGVVSRLRCVLGGHFHH